MTSESDINTSPGATGTSDPPRGSSNSASPSQPAVNPASTSSLPTTNAQHQSGPQSLFPGLGANFAHDAKAPFTVSYDQEVYLQLMADEEGAERAGSGTGTESGTGAGTKKNKTPTQIYREKWVRRALNPAISDPRGEPSSIDFECAESQRVRERV
ncbi:hypothetical protein BDW62DRAFT_166028 [Aspergillus aurantiobrunneus]